MLKRIFEARYQLIIWGVIVSFLLLPFSSFAWASQDELIEIHKAIKAKGKKWVAGETSVSKLSPKEKMSRLGAIIGPLMEEEKASAIPPDSLYATGSTLPARFDWRSYNGLNYVTPVRDQKNCGSCWAFATAAALESQILIAANTPGVDLNVAEQVLLSCSNAGNCGGGYISLASSYIRDTGLPAESCYPYTATNGSCPDACPNWPNYAYQILKWHYAATTFPTVEALRNALVLYGPLVTTMQVYSDFFYYVGGIYSQTYGSYKGGHAVLIVGYDDAGQYFTVKNSWGTGWGEGGFFRIAYSELNSLVYFGNYTIAYEGGELPFQPLPEAASITVTAPNGGETWMAGTAQTIRWTYTGNPGQYVKIELFKGSNLYMTISSSSPIGSGGSGSYNWAIPSGQAPGTDYRIRVTSTTDSQYLDVSNSYFTIAAPTPPAIRVSAPNGGEAWPTGTTQTIRWTYEGSPGAYVRIDLLKGGLLYSTLSSSAPIGSNGSGSFSWTIPSTQAPASDYQVQVTSTVNGSLTDRSDGYFSITAQPAPETPAIRVVYPNGGETLMMGTTVTIRWAFSGAEPGENVRIDLLRNGLLYRTIASSVPIGSGGNGSYDWTVPATLEPWKKYKVRVTIISSGVRDSSDQFFTISR